MHHPTRTLLILLIATSALACDEVAPSPNEAGSPSEPLAQDAPQGAEETLAEDEGSSTLSEERADGGQGERLPGGEEGPRAQREADATREDEEEAQDEPDDAAEVIDAILAVEGPQVIPQTQLHLESGDADCEGEALQFQWSVAQPEGSVSHLIPSSTHPNPTFEANVAGEYVFELLSFGEDGELCTAPHRFTLSVLPVSAIHIELLWHTPGDPDESDEGPEAGADLDLHFIRQWPDQEDPGWFDQPFDCFWFNPHPNWGSLDPTVGDDPSLDRDDTDGAGPENLNMGATEEDAIYNVMVHQWSDHDFGDSLATIRVYLFGQLSYERSGVLMSTLDAWDVGTLTSDYTFVPKSDDAGEPLIVEGFMHPLFARD